MRERERECVCMCVRERAFTIIRICKNTNMYLARSLLRCALGIGQLGTLLAVPTTMKRRCVTLSQMRV